jgi:hypothetical protein
MTATTRSWLYTISFAFTVTLTIYATLEIEYPSKGCQKSGANYLVILEQ